MKENQGLKEQLKREDPIELPMDEMFFDKLHDKIMADVAKTEIKPTTKWAKPWVFLERQARYYRPSNNVRSLHVVKMGLVGISLTLGLGLATMSLKLFDMSSQNQMAASNRQQIIEQALENPQDWVEMAASVQNDSDFYAEVLNERLSSNQGVDLQL